jgi:hypothetical protein
MPLSLPVPLLPVELLAPDDEDDLALDADLAEADAELAAAAAGMVYKQ